MKTWIILDGQYLCYRARFSMGDLSHQGSPTGAIYGFLKTVLALREQFDPYSCVFCWDSKYSKRAEIFPEYKAKRHNRGQMTDEEWQFEQAFRKQVKLLRKEYLPTIGFRNVFQQKGYESDDLMASVAYYSVAKEDRVYIITADHDLFQCIGPTVSVYNPRERKDMTLQVFHKQYGIDPKDWIYVKCWAGCDSDNVPGIRGIGEKTAILFLRGELKPSSKACRSIQSDTEIVVRNEKLIRLPFPDTKKFKLKRDILSDTGWQKVCDKLGFKSIRDRSLLQRR
jgi:5'-3' exonuclease